MVAGSGQLNFTRKRPEKTGKRKNVLNNAWESKIFAAESKAACLNDKFLSAGIN